MHNVVAGSGDESDCGGRRHSVDVPRARHWPWVKLVKLRESWLRWPVARNKERGPVFVCKLYMLYMYFSNCFRESGLHASNCCWDAFSIQLVFFFMSTACSSAFRFCFRQLLHLCLNPCFLVLVGDHPVVIHLSSFQTSLRY